METTKRTATQNTRKRQKGRLHKTHGNDKKDGYTKHMKTTKRTATQNTWKRQKGRLHKTHENDKKDGYTKHT